MKALALLTAAALSLLSVAASAQNRTVLRQGQGPAAAGRYQRLVRAIGGTGHCAGPFSFWAGMSASGCRKRHRRDIAQCPLLAQSGHPTVARQCPLLGE
jgi:hypothetical protein